MSNCVCHVPLSQALGQMSQRDFGRLLQRELAALFVAAFLAALFFLGQGPYKAAIFFGTMFAILQPFLLYDYFRRQG